MNRVVPSIQHVRRRRASGIDSRPIQQADRRVAGRDWTVSMTWKIDVGGPARAFARPMSKLITLVTIMSAITLGACLSGADDDLVTDETLASSTNPHPDEVSCLDRFETTYSEWVC